MQQSQGALPFNTNFLANGLALKVKNKRPEEDATCVRLMLFTFPAIPTRRTFSIRKTISTTDDDDDNDDEQSENARFAY